MLQLRIKQNPKAEGHHQVDLELVGDGAPRAATSTFAFGLSPQDEEDLRWYLEDFLQYPQEPAPTIAQRVEGRMAEVGAELFKAVFQANDDTREVWSRVREQLPETRIEVVAGVTEAATIPWELLREPSTTSALALTVNSFVRAQPILAGSRTGKHGYLWFENPQLNDLAVTHNQLGLIYGDAGDLDLAVQHYRESIHYEEMRGNLYGAARARSNMAIALLAAGRRADALEYAESALRGFESYGERAVEEIEKARRLIARIGGG